MPSMFGIIYHKSYFGLCSDAYRGIERANGILLFDTEKEAV